MAAEIQRVSAEALRKTEGRFVRIGDCLYVRNGRLYGVKTIKGKMVRAVAPLRGLEAYDGRGRPTAAAKRWVRQWGDQLIAEAERPAEEKRTVPSLDELAMIYEEVAGIEFELNGTPRPSSVEVVLRSFRLVYRGCGLRGCEPVTALDRAHLDAYVAAALAKGVKPVSVFAHLSHVRGVFARWALERYRARGLAVAQPDLPRRRGRLEERVYVRPPEGLRERTLAWYHDLEAKEPRVWVAASLMLQFGMRNGDAGRLTWDRFQREGERVVLAYRPQKTARSSGRLVRCVMSVGFYERLRAATGAAERPEGRVVKDATETFRRINSEMRALGWVPPAFTKGAYELRKMCIDRIYREFGAEAAVQVSGDDIRTVCRFYADPSRACDRPMELA